MQILRGAKLSTKFTVFLLLALSTAFSLALIHPQPVNAEGYLFGKVRCAVRTVFNRECEKKVQPVAEEPRQSDATSNGSTGTVQNSGATPAGGTNTAQGSAGGIPLEPIEIPEELQVSYTEIELPKATPVTNNSSLNESEYAAYFNAFSPYAVAGAHTTAAANESPVQRSADGWRLFGVAWYWWALAGVVIGTLIVSGRSVVRTRTAARTISKI